MFGRRTPDSVTKEAGVRGRCYDENLTMEAGELGRNSPESEGDVLVLRGYLGKIIFLPSTVERDMG